MPIIFLSDVQLVFGSRSRIPLVVAVAGGCEKQSPFFLPVIAKPSQRAAEAICILLCHYILSQMVVYEYIAPTELQWILPLLILSMFRSNGSALAAHPNTTGQRGYPDTTSGIRDRLPFNYLKWMLSNYTTRLLLVWNWEFQV